MKRITEFEIGGRSYPLNFSVKAAELFAERYGDVSEIGKAFEGENTAQMLSEFTWILFVLIEQGCLYKNLVENANLNAPTFDDLKVIIGLQDLFIRRDELMRAIVSGMETTVEAEVDPKNVEATQGK